MSKERKLLLSDEDAIRIGVAAGGDKFVTLKTIALGVRDYFQSLIDEGKLRVVEDVDLHQEDELVPLWYCSKCNWRNTPSHYPYCPGCGNKIKRDGDR